MPNWAYLIVTLVYNLALAVWIGGAIALGALTAPALFAGLERSKAGDLFGLILRKFARQRLVALLCAIAAALIKYLAWETRAGSQYGFWMSLRWVAIVVMATAVLYEIFYLEGALARHRADASGPAFQSLHRRAELILSGSVAAATAALLIN